LTGGRPPKGGPKECKRCGALFQRRCGNQRYCEACRQPRRQEYASQYGRQYYAWNALKIKTNSKRWRVENRARARYHSLNHARKMSKIVRRKVIGYYSKGTFACMCCGESEVDFLAIDHVTGNANRASKEQGLPRAGTSFYRWLFTNDFPDGYETLCANCNLSKQKHGFCIHKAKFLAHDKLPG
jgi:hypothetical protein